jgi:hypothetical protein
MISVVGLEYAVMQQCVALVGIGKRPNRPVHDEFVQQPFKNRTISDGDECADGCPE